MVISYPNTKKTQIMLKANYMICNLLNWNHKAWNDV